MSAAVGTYGRAQSVSSNNFKVKDKVGLAPLNYSNMLLVYETLHGQIPIETLIRVMKTECKLFELRVRGVDVLCCVTPGRWSS